MTTIVPYSHYYYWVGSTSDMGLRALGARGLAWGMGFEFLGSRCPLRFRVQGAWLKI